MPGLVRSSFYDPFFFLSPVLFRCPFFPMVYEEISDPFRRLVRIMERLQEPGGCPWDLEQSHESLKPYMIEEAYEAVEAIDRGDLEHLGEELGDVLLQVIFHSVLAARTHGVFGIDDVCRATAAKMVRRHPHVFGETEARTASDVLNNWEKLKAQERARKAARPGQSGASPGGDPSSPPSSSGVLSGVPPNLPALLRSQRMQEKAAGVGFDWPEPLQVLDKVEEELRELRQAMASGDTPHAREELGDLFFSLVNVARFLKVDAEDSARMAAEKFRHRFEHIEERAAGQGRATSDLSPEEMEALWNEAKEKKKGG